MANGEIKFKVGFDVNKAGLDNLRQTLSHLKSELGKQIDFSKSLKTDKANKELLEVQTTINNVQNALRNSFNTDLGTLNVAKFNAALKDIGIQKIQTDFNKMGAAGQIAFKNLATQAMTTNMQLKQSHSMIDKMAETLGNTLKWNISSGAINRMTGAIQQAWGFTKSLDNSLNDIMIVTGKSADEMERFSRQANKAAKELSAGTTDYTKASLIYYQQGLSDEEAAARAETTLKVANVTGQNADTVSQNLTAVWNGYKVSAEEAELYIDKLSAVAATTAADLDGLSTGMSKVASAANLMGVDVDQLNATLATVISVTQQAPESVGTAFKTIYARMGDIEAGLDTETTLGEYTSKVKEIAGVNVLDTNNQLRDMGEVIEEIGDKWTTLSREQQIALSQAMAGTRQYNNLLSLFDNWDMYTDALNESANAAGTLQEQQETYQQTVEASLQELRTTFEGLYMELFDTETIKDMVDMITSVMEKIESFIKAIGGGGNTLSALGAIATRVFSKQIAQGIATTITNFKIAQDNASQLAAQFQTIELFGGRQNVAGGDKFLQDLTKMKKSVLDLGNLVTNEQHEQANSIIKTTNELQNQKIAYEESLVKAAEFLGLDPGHLSAETYKDDTTAKDEAEKAIEAKEKQYQELFKLEEEYQEKRKKYDKQVNKTIQSKGDDYKKNLTEEQKIREELNKTIHKSIRASVEQTEKMNLSEEEQKELNQALQKYNDLWNEIRKNTSKGQAPKLTDEARQAGEEVLGIVDKVANNFKNKTNGAKETVKNASGTMKKDMEEAAEAADRAWKNFINNLQTVKNIQSFVQILGGINQITSGLRSLWNITEILNNEELSGGEKALQIISALSMGLSMLISGTLSVVTLLPTLTGLINADTVATIKNTYAKGGLALVMEKIAKKSLRGFINCFKTATNTVNAARIAIVGFSVAALAAIGLWAKWIQDKNESIRKQEEIDRKNSQNKLEVITKQQEEMQSTDDLVSSYMDLYNVYKKTGEASENFLSTKDQIVEALGLEKAAIANLTGDYKSLTVEILKAKGAQAQKESQLAWEAMIENEKLLSSNMFTKESNFADYAESAVRTATGTGAALAVGVATGGAGLAAVGAPVSYELTQNSSVLAQNDRGYIQFDPSLSTGDEIGIAEYFDKFGVKYEDAGAFGTRIYQDEYETPGQVVALYEKLNAINEEIINNKEDDKDSEEYSALLDIINNEDLKKFYDDYKEQQEIHREALAKTELYNDETIDQIVNIQNQKDYQKAKESIKDIVDTDKEYEELTDAEKDKKIEELVIEAIGKETAKNYEDRIAFTNELKEQFTTTTADYAIGYGAAFSDPSFLNGGVGTLAQARVDMENTISELSDEEFSALTTVVDIDRLKSKEIFDAYVEYAKEYAKAQEIELKISTTEDLANSLKEGKELTEEQKTALEKLEEEYPNLQSIQDKTSKDYIKNLLKVNQYLEEQRIITEEAATSALISYALELDVNTDEFEETMKGITEQQYKVLVAVEADIQSDFDNLVNNMDDIDSIASKIGDDFIVAASDLEELNDVFPGILANMELTEDGSVKLNSTITKEAIEAAKNQIKADTATTVEKLNNQAKELETKRDAARMIAKQLREGYDGEKLTDEAKRALTENLAVFKSETNAELATQEQTDAKNIAQASADSAKDMVTNYATAYEQMSIDATEWAKIAQQALKASTDVNADLPQMPGNDFGTKDGKKPEFATTVAINESEVPDFEQLKEDLNNNNKEGLTQEEAKRLAEYFDNLANSYDETINNIYGKEGEALARENEQLNKLNNIQSGKGTDGQKSKDEIDYIEKEVDLYREVNLELAKQEKLLSKLQKEQDKLNGKKLIDNLNEQLEVIEQQKQALIEKAAIARKEAQTHRDSLESQGVQFDEEGYITNYDEMLKYKEDYLKRVTEKYNSLTEAEQKNYKKYLDEAETDYENFKNSMDRYTDIISEELPSYIEEFEDKLDEEIEINISKFNYEVEISLDLSNAKRQWNEFTRDIFLDENDTVGISNSYLKDMETYEKDAQDSSNQAIAVKKELEIINAGGYSEIYGTDAKKAEEDLLKYQEDTIAAMRGAKETAEQSRQLWLSGIDDSISELNESAEVYETLDSLYNHDMNMVNMLYGEDAYDRIDNIYAQKQTNDLEEIDNIKKRAEYYQQMMDAETDPEAKEKWKKAWLSTINELTSKTEEAVKTVLDKHANAVKKTIEEMNEKILPKDKNGITMDLDLIGEEWDLIRENGERYLDNIEVGFGIQDFQNSFEDAFDATDSIAGQNKLNKVYQEQLDILKEKDKLSQYDLDRAQAMLDIELKKIALEEARQNKSSMRLRRDAQGNYSYQYVEDEEATKDAKKDLQDAQKGLYQLDKEKYLEDVRYVYDKTKELEDKIIELYNDTTLTNEEREQKKALLIEQYAPQIEEATKKVEESKVNLGNSTKIVMGAIGDEIVKDFVGSEGVGTLPEMESGMSQFVENIGKEGGMKSILETTFNTLDGVLDDTEQSIKDIGEAAGENFETTGIDNIGENAKDSKGYVDKLKTSVSGLKTKVDELIKKEKAETEALKALSKQADQRLDDLISTESQIRKNTEAMQEYINKLKETRLEEAKKANEESKKKDPSDTPKKNPSSNAKKTPKPKQVPVVKSPSEKEPSKKDNASKTEKAIQNGKIEIGDQVMFNGKYYYDTAQYVPGTAVRQLNLKDNDSRDFSTVLDYRPNETHPVKISFPYDVNPNVGWVQKEDIFMYKTGGLVDKTGPAWLDGTKSQPELVLNSKDTQNLLDTVKILRNADSLANSLNRSMSERMEARLNTEFKRLSNMMDIIKIERESGKDSLEQNVHIKADFPNVSDSNEIEQALMNLVNVASQYAYRR